MGRRRCGGWGRRSTKSVGLDGGVHGASDGDPGRSGGAVLVQTDGAAGMSGRQLPIILGLGTTQTLAWASSYYLPAILSDPPARDLGVAPNWVFAAFSASLGVAAPLGPRI